MPDVLVMGSHRARESYGADSRRAEEFKETAFALGKSLAAEGHRLMLVWSHLNLESQLGIKPVKDGAQAGKKGRNHPQSHPYWESADYHVLRGYLSACRQHPEVAERAGVTIEVIGGDQRFEGLVPFPDAAALIAKLEEREDILDCRKLASNPAHVPDFDAGEWMDVRDFLTVDAPMRAQGANGGIVELRPAGSGVDNERRQAVLRKLAGKVDAVIVLGGGNATEPAAELAAERGVLLAIGAFSEKGAFGDIEKQAVANSPGLAQAMRELKRRSLGDARTLADRLPRGLNAVLKSVATYRRWGWLKDWDTRAIAAAIVLIQAAVMLLCWRASVGEHLTSPESWLVMGVGLVGFLVPLLLNTLQLLVPDKRVHLILFAGSGILAVLASWSAMTTAIGTYKSSQPLFASGAAPSPGASTRP